MSLLVDSKIDIRDPIAPSITCKTVRINTIMNVNKFSLLAILGVASFLTNCAPSQPIIIQQPSNPNAQNPPLRPEPLEPEQNDQPSGPMAGGFTTLRELSGDSAHASDLATEAVRTRFGVIAVIINAESQIVAGTNYRFILRNSSSMRTFSVVVFRSLEGDFQITDLQETTNNN